MRWRVSGADYQMRNPNSIIDSLQRKYEKDIAPLLGENQKRKKPRSVPPMQAPAMSRMRTSGGHDVAILDEAEGQSALSRAGRRWSWRRPCCAGRVLGLHGRPAGDGSGQGEDVPLPPFTETALSREVESREDGARGSSGRCGTARSSASRPTMRTRIWSVVPGPERRAGLRARVGRRVGLNRRTRRGAACVRPRNIERDGCVHACRDARPLARLKDAALLYATRRSPGPSSTSPVQRHWQPVAGGLGRGQRKGAGGLGGRRAEKHAR